jgi:hypothetical protein
MATSINIRSPRIVDISGTANQETKVELFIWNSPSSIPASPTYTLEKPIPSSLITETSYDISPFCKSFISHRSFVPVTSDTAAPVNEYCYCTVKEYLDGVLNLTTEFICFSGYGYHNEGENPQHNDRFLTAGDYNVQTSGSCGSVYYHDDQAVTWQARYTGLSTGGVTTITLAYEVGYIPYLNTAYIGEGNKLEIIRDSVVQSTYNFYEVDECKYTPVNCDFVNKHGEWQRIVFFKSSVSNFEMNSNEYNLMPSSTNYNIKDNVRQAFNINGNDKITVNTGWVFESYSDTITQLMLSEKILLDDIPMLVTTKSIDKQTGLNNKNINYKLEFKDSAPKLNYNT